MRQEELGFLEHPIVVDRPPVGCRGHRERRVELAGELLSVPARARIESRFAHRTWDRSPAWAAAALDSVPVAGEAPPRRVDELAGMRRATSGRRRRRPAAWPDAATRSGWRNASSANPSSPRHRQGVGEHELHHSIRQSRREAELDAASEGVTDQGHPVEAQAVEGGGEGIEHLARSSTVPGSAKRSGTTTRHRGARRSARRP